MPMKTGTPNYQPGTPPADPAQIPRYLMEEQNKIKAVLDALAEGFDPVVHAEPAKPSEGMRRYADGTDWNPGSGPGLYRFDGTVWNFLG